MIYDDKDSWGEGPWQNETDRLYWIDPSTSYPCLIRRVPVGSLCGYVAVPPGHPAHGKSAGEVDVTVHGGLTYASKCQGEICHVPAEGASDDVWWLGFDCAHYGDLVPQTAAILRSVRTDKRIRGEVYRDIDYVRQQVRSLAWQLRQMTTICR